MDVSLFSRLGLFIKKDFLKKEFCKVLRTEMRLAGSTKALIETGDSGFGLDETVRKAWSVEVAQNRTAHIKYRLTRLRSNLENHFELALHTLEEPQFLKYKKGYFYRPHRDATGESDSLLKIDRRLITAIIFLNSESENGSKDNYRGGSLAFYGLIEDERWRDYGFSLRGEEGMLVAFRSTLFHEVTPVTQGQRYAIVSWFY